MSCQSNMSPCHVCGSTAVHTSLAVTFAAALQLLTTTNQDQVQAAACSALGRILRFRPQLIPAVAVSGGQTLRSILEIHDSRLQVRHRLTCRVTWLHRLST